MGMNEIADPQIEKDIIELERRKRKKLEKRLQPKKSNEPKKEVVYNIYCCSIM